MMMTFVVTLFLIWVCCSPGVHGTSVKENAIMHGTNFKVYAYEVCINYVVLYIKYMII